MCTENAVSIEVYNNGKSIKEKYDFYNNSGCFCALFTNENTIQDRWLYFKDMIKYSNECIISMLFKLQFINWAFTSNKS